ncbi:MAG TPA: sigma-54 dependent transcriptional regulator [Thermoanaerobaculaceae bacterium]|nr:sigma-54 dependent transcriptional regulator [Thermoanaerobaculaceae bacterium]
MSEKPASVCVVDDDRAMRDSLASLIRSAGLQVETFPSAQAFLARARTELPGCLLLDVNLPGLSGLDLQEELARADLQVPIVFLTGYGDIPTSVRAMKSGALEFFTKPFDDEALLAAIQQAVARASSTRSKNRNKVARAPAEQLIGRSPALRTILTQVELVAHTDSTVLLLGETGTGKELVARSIHHLSSRSARPLVSVNCGAIQPSLIASELFGHEKGSFTGALHQRVGRFELADGGTIFLDEIGDLPVETQISLLRVLQERELERVGGNQTIRVDTRVIAATNRDLEASVASGSFRRDLFYRLNVFPIRVPPLRERKEDIPLLVQHFLRTLALRSGHEIRSVDARTMELLQRYSWPGNVRELQNVIERWAIVCDSEEISMDESWLPREPPPGPADPAPSPGLPLNLRDYIQSVEREIIGKTLSAAGGNQSEAARRLGVSRGSLIERLKKYGPLTG